MDTRKRDTTLTSTLQSVRRTAVNYGSLPAAYDIALRSLNKCIYYRTMQCIVIDEVPQSRLALPEHFRFVKLEPQDLFALTQNHEYEMEPGFLQHALNKGDECFAIMDESTVASYGWYARSVTPLDPDDLVVHFDARYVYMYKGFTLRRYRGQRLHAIGMAQALAEYQSRGFKGLVSFV